jgi:hypothetical protein
MYYGMNTKKFTRKQVSMSQILHLTVLVKF